MMAEEDVARLRAAWLRGEKALLAKHRAQYPAHSGIGCAILAEEPVNSSANAVCAAGVGFFGIHYDGRKDDLERVNARSRVFQRLSLFMVHVLALLRLRKPKPRVDSVKS